MLTLINLFIKQNLCFLGIGKHKVTKNACFFEICLIYTY